MKWIIALALIVAAAAMPVAAQDVTPEATMAAADLSPGARIVLDEIAQQLDIPADQIVPISEEPGEFDGCMSAGRPEEMCTMIANEGYRVTFEAPAPVGRFVVHLTTNGDTFRFVEPLADAMNTAPAIFFEQAGGFAGMCHRLIVAHDGYYAVAQCWGNDVDTILGQGFLDEPALTELTAVVEQYADFQWPLVEPVTYPDQFIFHTLVNGAGDAEIDEATATQLEADLSRLTSSLWMSATPMPSDSASSAAADDTCSVAPVATPCPTIVVR